MGNTPTPSTDTVLPAETPSTINEGRKLTLGPFQEAYWEAYEHTAGFTKVTDEELRDALLSAPRSLRVFRMLLGYTADELAAAVTVYLTAQGRAQRIGGSRVVGMEHGRRPTAMVAAAFAQTINRLVSGAMWGEAEEPLRPKLAKPDTEHGWDSVRKFAQHGVPFEVYLHQRFYGERLASSSTPPAACAVTCSNYQ